MSTKYYYTEVTSSPEIVGKGFALALHFAKEKGVDLVVLTNSGGLSGYFEDCFGDKAVKLLNKKKGAVIEGVKIILAKSRFKPRKKSEVLYGLEVDIDILTRIDKGAGFTAVVYSPLHKEECETFINRYSEAVKV